MDCPILLRGMGNLCGYTMKMSSRYHRLFWPCVLLHPFLIHKPISIDLLKVDIYTKCTKFSVMILNMAISKVTLTIYFRYKNRPQMTFDDTGSAPEQEFEMHPDPTGVLQYSTKYVYSVGSSSMSKGLHVNWSPVKTSIKVQMYRYIYTRN